LTKQLSCRVTFKGPSYNITDFPALLNSLADKVQEDIKRDYASWGLDNFYLCSNAPPGKLDASQLEQINMCAPVRWGTALDRRQQVKDVLAAAHKKPQGGLPQSDTPWLAAVEAAACPFLSQVEQANDIERLRACMLETLPELLKSQPQLAATVTQEEQDYVQGGCREPGKSRDKLCWQQLC
jgi:hypothetical protein